MITQRIVFTEPVVMKLGFVLSHGIHSGAEECTPVLARRCKTGFVQFFPIFLAFILTLMFAIEEKKSGSRLSS